MTESIASCAYAPLNTHAHIALVRFHQKIRQCAWTLSDAAVPPLTNTMQSGQSGDNTS